jgi:hypothetical protein
MLKFNYYEVALGREATVQRALRDHVQQALGDHLVAVFAPSLGYATNQALVLTDDAATAGAVLKAPGVVSGQHHGLTATTRPTTSAVRPKTDGIYVHRWFTIDGGAVDEFVALSNEAWVGFEGGFDSDIFGLFVVDASPEDVREGARRMLLMTHYRDFATWEASRKPDPKTARAFARRRELSRFQLPRACVAMSRS